MNSGSFSTVILADGQFPLHPFPLSILSSASRIICCDGAVKALTESGYEPFAIVGDCDSIGEELSLQYADRIFRIPDQETNDLTKSVKWCAERGLREIVILGGTGKREDHTLGNISLLADYALFADIRMVTDSGTFYPLVSRGSFDVMPGQQVSIFSIDPKTEITSEGLKYPLRKMHLNNWWQATLNEAVGNSFSLQFSHGALIVFIAFVK